MSALSRSTTGLKLIPYRTSRKTAVRTDARAGRSARSRGRSARRRCSRHSARDGGDDVSALLKGRRYVGTATATNGGVRIFRDVEFVASRDQDPEGFIRGREETPGQDRVFVQHPRFGSWPCLVVAGSIREAVAS